MKDPYVSLEYENLIFQVKVELDGIVLDLFKGDEIVESKYKLWEDMINGEH